VGSDFSHQQVQTNAQDVQDKNQQDMKVMTLVVVGTAINFFF
jgi:hypothetical protein